MQNKVKERRFHLVEGRNKQVQSSIYNPSKLINSIDHITLQKGLLAVWANLDNGERVDLKNCKEGCSFFVVDTKDKKQWKKFTMKEVKCIAPLNKKCFSILMEGEEKKVNEEDVLYIEDCLTHTYNEVGEM